MIELPPGLLEALDARQRARAACLHLAAFGCRSMTTAGELAYVAEWIELGRGTDDPMETDLEPPTTVEDIPLDGRRQLPHLPRIEHR